MKDIELVDVLFSYMYEKDELIYYRRALSESGVNDGTITPDLIFRLHGLLKSSGFVEEINKMVENHPVGLKLNGAGYQMMLKYGSYGKYLKEKRKEKNREQNVKKSTIRLNYATMIIAVATFIGGILLSNQVKALWRLFLSIFE